MIPTLLLALSFTIAHAAPSSGSPESRQAQAEYLRGTLLERRGAYADALKSYENAMALDPAAAFIAGEAAELSLELEDYERAEKWARKRLELAPRDARSRVILGRVLWTRGDFVGARGEFEKALEADPASAENLFALTELVAVRDPKGARKLLEQFLFRNPEHAARALFELARLDAQEERFMAAVEKLERAIALDDSESGPARRMLAQVYEVTHATAAAVEEYQRLLVAEPNDTELWSHVGELQAAAGTLEEARDTFTRLKQKYPNDPAACAWLAADAERSGDFARAARALQDSSALKDDPTLNLRLGYYQLQAGGIKEAMMVLRAARQRWPKDDRIAYYLALGNDDQGDHASAVKLLGEVVSVKPEDREARWQLATILEKMNKMPEAEIEFRRLIADKSDDAPALNYLGYSLADRGQKLDDALALIKRALVIEPGNPAYRDSLGWIFFKLGRSTEAARELAIAARALPEDESVWDHLGDARSASGREEGAWRAWRLSQISGGTKSGAKADALQKVLTPEGAGELWRSHLEAVHGGLKKLNAVCEVKGHFGSRSVVAQALLSFRAPKELTLEILGPMFSPVARARVDERGFTMDHLNFDGVAVEQLGAAAEEFLSAVASWYAGEPFLPGPAKFESGWGRRNLVRTSWRVELDDTGLARTLSRPGGTEMALSEYEKLGTRRYPKTFSIHGRFWELSLSCPQPKFEAVPEPTLPEAP